MAVVNPFRADFVATEEQVFFTGVTPGSADALIQATSVVQDIYTSVQATSGDTIAADAAWEQYGASMADSPFDGAFHPGGKYGAYDDTALIQHMTTDIFGPSYVLSSEALTFFTARLAEIRGYYGGVADVNDPTGDIRAKGALAGDMLKEAYDGGWGPFTYGAHQFLIDDTSPEYGQSFDHQTLGPVIEEVPTPPIIITVPGPAEQHVITYNTDGTADPLGQSATHPGTLITGSGIPADHMAKVMDQTSNVELDLSANFRTSATFLDKTIGPDGLVHLAGVAGAQDGTHGEQGANANRGAVAINFGVVGGPNALQDYTYQLKLDIDPTAGVNYKTLTLTTAGNTHAWVDANHNVVIGDDPQNLPLSVAENSMNMAFSYWLGNANVPAGHYDVILQEVGLVGLNAGQVLAQNHIVLDLS